MIPDRTESQQWHDVGEQKKPHDVERHVPKDLPDIPPSEVASLKLGFFLVSLKEGIGLEEP